MSKQDSHSNTLGDKLRRLRDQKNLMQREVGAVIDLDGAFISKVENNEKPINRKHLATLSIFFNIPEEELQTLWLADKIYKMTHKEATGLQSLEIVINSLKQQYK